MLDDRNILDIVSIYMNGEYIMKKKFGLYYFLLILGIIGLGRTFNNSVRLIEHIFKPIHIGSCTLFYGQLLNVIIIFIGIKGLLTLYNVKKSIGLKTIFLLLLCIVISVNTWNHAIKWYMSRQDDLNAIYYDHEDTCYGLDLSNKTITIYFNLENCSDVRHSFSILVYILDEWKKYGITTNVVKLPDEYTIHAHEKLRILEEITISIDTDNNYFNDNFLSCNEIMFELYTKNNKSQMIKHVY